MQNIGYTILFTKYLKAVLDVVRVGGDSVLVGVVTGVAGRSVSIGRVRDSACPGVGRPVGRVGRIFDDWPAPVGTVGRIGAGVAARLHLLGRGASRCGQWRLEGLVHVEELVVEHLVISGQVSGQVRPVGSGGRDVIVRRGAQSVVRPVGRGVAVGAWVA